TTGGDLKAAGPMVERALAAWAKEVARPVGQAVVQLRPDAAVTSLFGVEVMKEAELSSPWAVVNSTFYVGPNPPRPVEEDIGPRATSPRKCQSVPRTPMSNRSCLIPRCSSAESSWSAMAVTARS